MYSFFLQSLKCYKFLLNLNNYICYTLYYLGALRTNNETEVTVGYSSVSLVKNQTWDLLEMNARTEIWRENNWKIFWLFRFMT